MAPAPPPPQRRLRVLCRHVGPARAGAAASPAGPLVCPTAQKVELRGTYDFIVVGAGSAGCVVAARLSEDPNVSVLLIEAGGTNQVFAVRSPFITCPDLQNSERDWAFRTVPQAQLDGRVSHWPRGKTLGGCSSINYMLYVRGDPRNFDYWAKDLGCSGWSYDEVLPYFLKSENYLGSTGEAGRHGKGGELSVTHMGDGTFLTKEVSERFVSSCRAAGLPKTDDYNGARQEGASLCQITVRNAVRCDTASAYLFQSGAINRPNLTVLTGHFASRLTFQGSRATGVCLRGGSEAWTTPELLVSARKEIVVCGGAVCTPWLLMLSGVGPADHLKEHNIPVVADLPVGHNLQDHLFVPLIYECKKGMEKHFFYDKSVTDVARLLAEYALFGRGMAAYPWVTAMAFLRSGVRPESHGNDLQVHLVPLTAHDQEQMKRNFGVDKRSDRPLTDVKRIPARGITLLPSLIIPHSVGKVMLKSADPSVYPIIDPQYLKDEADMAACVAGVRFVRKVATTGPLAEVLGPEVVDPSIPNPESEEYIREIVRRGAITIYHPMGTARMGAAGDPKAVVCPRLRVQGLTGLRVADASIIPMAVSGNTNAPSIMIGERAADFIKEDFGLKR